MRQVLWAVRDGPDRQVFFHHLDEHDRPLPQIQSVRGCRLGSVYAESADGFLAVELLFPRALARGEATLIEWVVVNSEPCPVDGSFERRFGMPVRVAEYDSYLSNGGWGVYGGTSVATPIVTAIAALAGPPNSGDTASSYPYSHVSALNDLTTGSDGSCGNQLCDAGKGWDGPTGLGTPNGVTAFTPGSSTDNNVTVTDPGNQTGTVGTAASLQIKATDSAGGQTLAYSASGLPAGMSIVSNSGLISGTPTTAGSYDVTVTKDTTGATGSASFTWTIGGTGGGGRVAVAKPADQWGFVGFQLLPLQVSATDSKGLALRFSATGLPPGVRISVSGLVSGTPTKAGTYHPTVKATDSGGSTGSAGFTFTIYT